MALHVNARTCLFTFFSFHMRMWVGTLQKDLLQYIESVSYLSRVIFLNWEEVPKGNGVAKKERTTLLKENTKSKIKSEKISVYFCLGRNMSPEKTGRRWSRLLFTTPCPATKSVVDPP